MAICSHRYFHVFRICMFHALQAGVIVLLPLGITKILCSHEWWLTTRVLALTENVAIVRYAKYGFQQSPSRHGSQKPGQKVSSQLFNRATLYWALWFEHNKCTSPDCDKSQGQYCFEDTSKDTFSLLWCLGKPKVLLRTHWAYMFVHWVLHKHQLMRKHSLHLTSAL